MEERWKEGEGGEEMERKGMKDLLWKNCKRFCNSRSRVKYEDGEKCEDENVSKRSEQTFDT